MYQKFKAFIGSALTLIFAITILSFAGPAVFAQTNNGTTAVPAPAATPLTPAISDLHGVSIGMTIDGVKEKLGKPKTSDKTGVYYEFSNLESAQIGLDEKKNVRTIAFIFSNGDTNAPTFADIFGPDVPLVPKEDGSIYKLVRYPAAGYWVAYSRTSSKKPMTVVTMRKMAKP